ncbi:MAG: alpha/beta hydrolase [Clostridia bacterium]|nr:alpha/beta hydrolase [Clostridia bacterium]
MLPAGVTDFFVTKYYDSGMDQLNFKYNGRDSVIIVPKHPLPGNPWVWRAEFFDAFPAVDVALAEQGWHIGYHMVSNLYGCQASIEYLRDFQDMVEREYHLHRQPVMLGFSRGGLYAVNYAAAYPSRIGGLYLDAPALDIRSWPGGLGAGTGDERCWKECMALYGLTEHSAPGFAQNPLDQAERVAAAGIPVVAVAGLADDIVPYEENLKLFASRFRKAGGHIQVFGKPGVGHHPHSLTDPTPVVDFIRRYCAPEELRPRD